MASVAIEVPSPRPQGAESLFMTLGAALTPRRSPLSGEGNNGGAISSAQMSAIRVNTSRNQINNSFNIVSLQAKRPDPSTGPGGQSN
ncbi:hypothetical protein L6164_022687 [Bauhinia variegata]|uniref:Uncharacterized protein n=2 Tax=Bauhinia variegata TaxID=167791 RepID=A0ACB9MG57_BAUVA|nr:hypothetical protein L6164_022684 [Bauhinia variegata]KAI4323050.1 hypothetical protein L6164_022687 [Bauhinia variegata]